MQTGEKSDDDDYHSPKSNSRPGTPQTPQIIINNLNDQVNRETLIIEDRKSSEYLSTSSSSSSTKPSPTVSVVTPPFFPGQHQDNIDIPSTNNNINGKTRKQIEQKPESSPKPGRHLAPLTKGLSSPSTNTNPTINKGNHTGAVGISDHVFPPHELRPVQRAKSKYHRRKMTEEEAIKELGNILLN